MFKIYNAKIKNLLSDQPSGTDWQKTLNHHRQLISHIQHERLIHLLVTLFVGLVTSSALFTALIAQSPSFLIFVVPLLFLFIGYLFHYRFLENTTQSWYQLEEEILQLIP